MSASTGVVLMAYGTPRDADDILRYYTDIRRGTPPSEEQLDALTARYRAIGGVSPLTERTEEQRVALQHALDRRAAGQYRVALGMKHSAPFIEDAVEALVDAGAHRLVGLVLAPHDSAASVGQYLERLADAAAKHDVPVRAIRSWATEPAFVDFVAGQVRAALATLPEPAHVLFTAHSLPVRSLTPDDPYISEVNATAEAVAARTSLPPWRVAWQSAGRTGDVWLAPDVLSVIDELAADGRTQAVLVSAVGFVADHLEVLYDLDIQAAQRAGERGLAFARTACVNNDAAVIDALAQRVMDA
jgi:protoporphyrin/coproporphyrin ferrochelatase